MKMQTWHCFLSNLCFTITKLLTFIIICMHFYGSSMEGILLVIAMRHCLLGEKGTVALSEFCAHIVATVHRFQCIFITA